MAVTISIYFIKKILAKKILDYAFIFKYEILQGVNFRRAFLFSLDQLSWLTNSELLSPVKEHHTCSIFSNFVAYSYDLQVFPDKMVPKYIFN